MGVGRKRAVRYELTTEGWELAPVLGALYEWGVRRAARDGITIQPAECD